MTKKQAGMDEIQVDKTQTQQVEQTDSVVAVREQAELPAVQEEPFDDGLGEITQDDLIIPRLKVGQKQSLGDVEGKLFIDVTGDVVDEMDIVILSISKSRVLFPEDFSRESKPLCKSNDLIKPELNDDPVFAPMAAECDGCPYAKWTKKKTGKPKPPECSEVWNMLVLDFDTFLPAWFSLKRKALKPGRKIISMLKLRGLAKKIPIWGYKFTVRVELSPGDSGDSYIPIFSGLTELKGEDKESLILIRNQLAGEKIDFAKDGDVGGGGEDGSPGEEEAPF